MAIEPKRGCGYRQVGGTYLVGGKLAAPCGRLPFPLSVCPACGHGIKPVRGWTWIEPAGLFRLKRPPALCGALLCQCCKLGGAPFEKGERAGLLWVGSQFYKTPEYFTAEASVLGISRRIAAIPHGFTLGVTWVFLAHNATPYQAPAPFKLRVGGIPLETIDSERAGVFAYFLPERIERILTQSQATPAELLRLADRGITPVIVPDDDSDHNRAAEAAEAGGGQLDFPDDDGGLPPVFDAAEVCSMGGD